MAAVLLLLVLAICAACWLRYPVFARATRMIARVSFPIFRSQHLSSIQNESAPYILKAQSHHPRWPFCPRSTPPMTLDNGMDPGNVNFGCPYCAIRYRDRVRLDAHVEEKHAHHGEELKCTHPDCDANLFLIILLFNISDHIPAKNRINVSSKTATRDSLKAQILLNISDHPPEKNRIDVPSKIVTRDSLTAQILLNIQYHTPEKNRISVFLTVVGRLSSRSKT